MIFARLCVLIFLTSLALAETRLVVGEVPGHANMTPAGMKGADYDLVMEMAKRVGFKGRIDIQPYPRALQAARNDDSVLIFPVARNPAREANYKWVAKLTEDEILVVADAGTTFNISSLEAVRDRSTGVLRSAVGDIAATEHGFKTVEKAAREEVNAKKLSAGRIDVWLGVWNAILTAQRNAGLDPRDLRRGVVVQRATAQLVGSPNLSDDEAKKWQDALASMKRDGTYDRIIRANQYELPK